MKHKTSSKKILIIGGGTTGWWAAGYLEHKFPEYDITLIESKEIPHVGVGESTLPMIATFFKEMGMEESDWMPRCNAVHKFGNIKQNFDKPDGEPFTFSFWYNDNNVFEQWYEKYKHGKVSKNQINDELYHKGSWSSIAYHLDAEHAGAIVKERCKNVKHQYGTLDELPDGYDLYIDCTGFRRQFAKDKTEIKLEHHLVDRAWVAPFELDERVPYTRSIARDHGWQFKIGLTTRVGTGYVFSSQHVSEEQALIDFKKFTKDLIPYNNKEPRLLKWRPSVLENPWTDNVVSIGLSNGFIDPLEANSLFMIQFSITNLAKCLERGYRPESYNRSLRKVWRDVSVYIQHHYMLSQRADTEFWKYYQNFNVKKSLWENYKRTGNKYTNPFPDAIWATLGLYYDEFDYFKGKEE